MSNNYGPGPSRVLSPIGRQFLDVCWQQGRPPLDSEMTLIADLANQWDQQIVARGVPSGWLGNETSNTDSFITNPNFSNYFLYGKQRTGDQAAVQWAVVNGWVVPVAGTLTGSPPGSPSQSNQNIIALNPPPSNAGDCRIDVAYLEVWIALIAPNPSITNKPASNAVYTLGNVLGGFLATPDDLIDPSVGETTTLRTQVQYAIRVVPGVVGLSSNPDGYDPATVFAQGAAASPTTYTFANMRQTLGDPGLWRAGDGSTTAQTALGTVDGYVYSIPICAVFRRNSSAWLGDPSVNISGAINRSPTAVSSSSFTTFSPAPVLASALSASSLSATLVSASNLPTPLSPATPILVQIGDELLTYSLISGTSPTLTMTLTARGVNGSRAEYHAAGATITILSGRPDGLFSDQIAKTDILDLRHAVNPNGFDYTTLLKYNFDKLLRGQLRANWKRTGAGQQAGPLNLFQDKIVAPGGGVALGVSRLDGPDNIRKVFSDAAVPQTVDFIVQPASVSGGPANVTAPWSLNLTINATQASGNYFTPGDFLQIPILQFKAGFPGGDADQVSFIPDVSIRIDGQTEPISQAMYTVVGSVNTIPTSVDDLVITFNPGYPLALTGVQLWVTVQVQYGPGRGVARRPDLFHQAAFVNPSGNMLVRQTGVPAQYLPMHTSWAPTWAGFRSAGYKGSLPVVTESYADLGSKTIAITPFRVVEWSPAIRTLDGTAANLNETSISPLSNGVTLPQATVYVVSTSGFASSGTFLTGTSIVTYTGITATSFTGCSGGYGTLYSGETVFNASLSSNTGVSFGDTSFEDLSVTFSSLTGVNAIQIVNGYQPGRYTFVSLASAIIPSGTFTVTNGSSLVPTSANQFGTLFAGTGVVFASQPGVVYTIANVSASPQQITLTANYSGTGSTTTATTPPNVTIDRNLPASVAQGTFSVTNGSAVVDAVYYQGGVLIPGCTISFTSQPGIIYTVASVAVPPVDSLLPFYNNLTLTTPYTGTTSPTTTATFGLVYAVVGAQGNMPLKALDGITSKWVTTDPLGLFSGTTQGGAGSSYTKNFYVTLPREAIPGWGEYHVPILWQDSTPFWEGINYMSLSGKASGPPPYADSDQNYVSYTSGIDTFSTFSTLNNNPIPSPAVYNSAWTDSGSGKSVAGLQFYQDTRGFGRQGLQLPPFYGIARLFAVYEAGDFYTNGSAYNSTTRNFVPGRATNLLRQNLAGPSFWVEIDADGDSTFILNAAAIDLSRSLVNPISTFAAGQYVIEVNVFGFDRGAFDLGSDFRLILNRNRTSAQANGTVTRSANIMAITGPHSVIQGPVTASDSIVLNYSRTPYQGDPWGSQTNYIDIGQFVGPLTSGNAYQLATTTLNTSALTRPNQKVLEVLASMPFATSLGTGRISGDADVAPHFNLRTIGYENPADYPPISSVEARPPTLVSDFTGDSNPPEIGTDLLGCTERLPLGALFRDKDFRGGRFLAVSPATLSLSDNRGEGFLGSLAVGTTYEQTCALVDSSTLASGAPGEFVVAVDGEQANYSLLVNFRTFRGGSAFAASGPYPGGELVSSSNTTLVSPTGHTNVLSGLACLVRNTVTSVGANQVSAGDELMLLVLTTTQRLTNTSPQIAEAIVGSNGSHEGYSAVDLYRIEGHPLMVDNVRADLNPSNIQLTKQAF